jgi:hypothetical protein
MTVENLTSEALRLLDPVAAGGMRKDLAEVAHRLSGDRDAILKAADEVDGLLQRGEKGCNFG